MPISLCVASSVGLFIVKIGTEVLVIAVLGHAHGHHLAGAVGPAAELVLGIFFQPAPHAALEGAVSVRRLSGLKGEEVSDLV